MFKNRKSTKSAQCGIATWRKFAREVRSGGCNLLSRLDEFPNSILVTGCQRSGTTILSRIITQSEGMVNYWFGSDDELDAALILSGFVPHTPQGRYCFQTTYLNECFHEYYDHVNGHKIIWVLRNPFSVVYSMQYNWKSSALNTLFKPCGDHLLNDKERWLYKWLGVWGVSKLKRACMSYHGKVSQLFELRKQLPQDTMMVVEYDNLASKTNETLPLIYKFLNLSYKFEYADRIHSKSLTKSKLLSKRERSLIEEICVPIYDDAKELATYYQ